MSVEKISKETNGGQANEWWVRWAELLEKLLKVKNTEQALKLGEKNAKQTVEIIKETQGEGGEFLPKLIRLLKNGESERVRKVVEARILEVEKKENLKKRKAGEKGFVAALVNEVENQSKDEPVNNDAKLKEIEKDVDGRAQRTTENLSELISKDGKKIDDVDIEAIRSELGDMKSEATAEQQEDNLNSTFDKWEDVLDAELVRTKGKRQQLLTRQKLRAKKYKVRQARELVEQFQENGWESVERGDEAGLDDNQLELIEFLFEKSLQESGDVFSGVLDEMMDSMSESDAGKIIDIFVKNNRAQENRGDNSGKEMNDAERTMADMLGKILGFGGDSDPKDTKKKAEGFGGFGMGISQKVIDGLGEDLKGIGIDSPLVENPDYGLTEVNPILSEKDKKKVNRLFQQELFEAIRFMSDEGVSLQEKQFEKRATRYVSLMSVMGLDTRMKSVVMDRYQAQYLAFMFGNGFVNNETTEQFQKFISKTGAEYNILSAFKEMEMMKVVGAGGKEVEIGETNMYKWEKVLSSKIVDLEDRRYFGLKDGQERTYATMMLRSNDGEQKSKDRARVTHRVLMNLGEDQYKKMVKDFGADDEGKLWKDVGDKYWDYSNQTLVYWLATQRLGEVVGNASPRGGEYVIPAGFPEFYMKRIPLMWAEFTGKYTAGKVVEILETITEMGISSIGAKEAGEVFGYLLNVDSNESSLAPGIVEALLGGETNDKKKVFAETIQQAVIEALYIQKRYHLGREMEKLSHHTPYYQDRPLKKTKDGKLKVDALSMRRDTATTVEKLVESVRSWSDDEIKMWEWGWIKKNFSHDRELLTVISGELSERKKIKYFFEHFGDDYMMPQFLSAKRPDDPVKYAGAYWDEIFGMSAELMTLPTWSKAIEMLSKIGSITGDGKLVPIRERVYAMMKYLREERRKGEEIVYHLTDEGGGSKYDEESWDGDLKGSRPLQKLNRRKVDLFDVRQGRNSKVSIATIKTGVTHLMDEPGDYKKAIRSGYGQKLYTEQGFREAMKDYSKEMRTWDAHKEGWVEGIEYLSGKKLLNYVAIEIFDMPPEMFIEWVLHNSKETFSPLWQYFNS